MFNAAGSMTIASRKSLIENATDLARRWSALPASEKRAILHALVAGVDIRLETIDVSIRLAALPLIVKPDLDIRRLPANPDGPVQVLSVAARLRRTGLETKLLIQGARGAEPPRRSDRSLQRLVAKARQFNDLVINSNGRSIRELAAEAGVSPSYFSRVFRLNFLSPDITKAILQGRQPPEFSAIKLMNGGQFAGCWSEQRRQFGFD
ncbi:MAG: helix-turn-helix transcriptional regulator [Hyphomicrobiaceae bacterium]